MDLFQNRAFAGVLAAVVIVVSIFFGGVNSMGRLEGNARAAIAQLDEDGFSAQKDLDNRASYASNCVKIASYYLEADNEAIEAVRVAREQAASAKTVEEKYEADCALEAAVDLLGIAMGRQEVAEKDEKSFRRESINFTSAGDTLSRCAYNQKATGFNQSLEQFPASFFAGLRSAEQLPLF